VEEAKKILESENIEITHPYMNIMPCTVSYRILGEHGDKERVSYGELV
jgi:hypothetical protein